MSEKRGDLVGAGFVGRRQKIAVRGLVKAQGHVFVEQKRRVVSDDGDPVRYIGII